MRIIEKIRRLLSPPRERWDGWPLEEVRYILRPGEGITYGFLPQGDSRYGRITYVRTRDEEGDLYVAVREEPR